MSGETSHNSKLALLLPFRCIVFLLVFIIGALITDKKGSDISDWW